MSNQLSRSERASALEKEIADLLRKTKPAGAFGYVLVDRDDIRTELRRRLRAAVLQVAITAVEKSLQPLLEERKRYHEERRRYSYGRDLPGHLADEIAAHEQMLASLRSRREKSAASSRARTAGIQPAARTTGRKSARAIARAGR